MKFSANRSPFRGALLLGALAGLPPVVPPAFAAAPAAAAVPTAAGEATPVSRTFFRSRIVDSSGRPILGLEPKDLEVRVGDRKVPILALEWYEGAMALEEEAAPSRDLLAAPRPRLSHGGQIYAFLVDVEPGDGLRAELEARRRYLAAVRGLIDALPEGAYAAVLARGPFLRLWQDFTPDRKRVAAAIQDAVRGGEAPGAPRAGLDGVRPVLAPLFDENRARLAVSTDLALEETARALDPLPGEKVLIYLRMGPGHFEPAPAAAVLSEAMVSAIEALRAARTSVFVLDPFGRPGVGFDRLHPSLLALEQLVQSTGGTYVSARTEPQPAARRLAQTLRGYYLVTLAPEALPEEETQPRVTVKLKRKRGEVLSSPLWTLVGDAASAP